MTAARKIKDALRGQVKPTAALLETGRRARVAVQERYERLTRSFEKDSQRAVQLKAEYARMSAGELLEHFRSRSTPKFFAGFEQGREVADAHNTYFPEECESLKKNAHWIVTEHRWPLLGFGELEFGSEIDWLRDRGDIRVLWELNRMGHLITLGRAYVLSGEEELAEEFFKQVESWNTQNRFGVGPNWSCAMEVALRAMNLLAVFHLFRRARGLTPERLGFMLRLFEQHGEYIRRHLEFSYIATSNHYLTNVVGLLWLGVSLPELQVADEWRSFGLRETLREMDKQVLGDGSHYEASTGYHRFVLELFLLSFILCQANSIEIPQRYWRRLRFMLEYTRAYLRPDGYAPLVGDTDSGQLLPVVRRSANEHAYLLSIGAVLFNEPRFKVHVKSPPELFWFLGQDSLKAFGALDSAGIHSVPSSAFSETGVFLMRQDDLYLLFNVSGVGLNGRGSHAHNDALSIEVSACGTNFIGDPGTFVYTGDYAQRQLFRSTGYHSTVEIDRQEQNTIEEAKPFRIADEARPQVLSWETGERRDYVEAEHYGYLKLADGAITHRRAVTFDKRDRYWLIEDTLHGSGVHIFRFLFHVIPNLKITTQDWSVEILDEQNHALLVIAPVDPIGPAVLEARSFSRDYGAKLPSVACCWTIREKAPLTVQWLILPICSNDDEPMRRRLIEQIGNRRSEI